MSQCGKLYVGETGKKLRTRESEHKRAIASGNSDHSGISRHVLETGHSIVWHEVKILDYETNGGRRKVKEGFYISRVDRQKSMNILLGWEVYICKYKANCECRRRFTICICFRSAFDIFDITQCFILSERMYEIARLLLHITLPIF